MNNQIAALSWEFARRSLPFQLLVAAILFAGPMGLAMFVQLRGVEPDFGTERPLAYHFNYLSLAAMAIGAICIQYQSSIRSRLNAYPVSAGGIVCWSATSAAITASVVFGLSFQALQQKFDLEWPILLPWLSLVACALIVQSAMHSLKVLSVSRVVAYIAIIAATVTWMVSCYGSFNPESSSQYSLTALQLGSWIAGITALLFWDLREASSNRFGEFRTSGLISKIRQRWFQSSTTASRSPNSLPGQFRSPQSAIAWLQWRQCGWQILAASTFAGAFLSLALYAVLTESPNERPEGLIILALVFPTTAGFLLGPTFSPRNECEKAMPGWLALQPLSTSELGRMIFSSLLRGSLASWFCMLGVSALFIFVAAAIKGVSLLDSVRSTNWYQLENAGTVMAAALLASWLSLWTGLSVSASIALARHRKWMERGLEGVPGILMVAGILLFFVIPQTSSDADIVRMRQNIVAGLFCTATLVVTLFVLWRAFSLRLIGGDRTAIAIGAWLIIVTLYAPLLSDHWLERALIGGWMSIAIVASGATPLAVAASRHR